MLVPGRGHGRGGRRVFSPEQEQEIANKIASGEATKRSLAADLGVHPNTIANVCRRVAPQAAKEAAA